MNKKYTFKIGIPTINRYDLLKESLVHLSTHFPDIEIYIIDNGKQGISSENKRIKVLEMPHNLGVAGSWNLLCKMIYLDAENAVILNDDIVWGYDQDQVQSFIDLASVDDHYFLYSERELSVFILPRKTYDLIGEFDQYFYPAYFEDNDYLYRLKLAGIPATKTGIINPVVYRNSMTIKKDPEINRGFMRNRELYISKWGGVPGQEKNISPFVYTQ